MPKRKYEESDSSETRHISKRLKTIIWDYRFGLEVGCIDCPCCGETKIIQSNFHCGHIIAHSKGGTLHKNNLIPICSQCNLSMSTTHMCLFMKQQFNRNLNNIIKEWSRKKKRIQSIFKVFKKSRHKTLKDDLILVINSF